MTNVERFELNGESQYKNITKVSFEPMYELTSIQRKYKEGDRCYWKLFGCIPLISYKVKKDKYKINGFRSLFSKEEVNNFFWRIKFKEGKIYKLPCVSIECNGEKKKDKYFDTNDEALMYIDNLKERCEEVGNSLK